MTANLWNWRGSIQTRYDAWLGTPDGMLVFQQVANRAKELRRRGFRHYGIAALFEAARYDYSLRVGPDADGFKLNNNWRSRLARDLMASYPELDGFFEVRELRS